MTKKELISRVSEGLAIRGLKVVPGPGGAGAASVHYMKRDQLLLLFGLEFSRHYDERFTGSFYLSQSFHWGYMLRTFPREAYRRVGDFLTADERSRLLEKEFVAPGVVDAWWISFTQHNVVCFLEAFDLALPRFISQTGLIQNILACKELEEYVAMVKMTVQLGHSLTNRPNEITFEPKNPKMGIGAEWYWAAEVVLRKYKADVVSKNYVELLAIDAWRHDHL